LGENASLQGQTARPPLHLASILAQSAEPRAEDRLEFRPAGSGSETTRRPRLRRPGRAPRAPASSSPVPLGSTMTAGPPSPLTSRPPSTSHRRQPQLPRSPRSLAAARRIRDDRYQTSARSDAGRAEGRVSRRTPISSAIAFVVRSDDDVISPCRAAGARARADLAESHDGNDHLVSFCAARHRCVRHCRFEVQALRLGPCGPYREWSPRHER
jgi:hypothetical protein